MLLIFLALGYLSLFARRKAALPILTLSVVIAVNIKFTALVYVLVISIVITLYFLFKKQMDFVRLVVMALLPGLLAGFLLVGYNPYVTNTLRKGNPFYPLAGPNAIDIMTANSPESFRVMNRFEKLFTSIFSKTENTHGHQKCHFKLPFTVKEEELKTIWVDTRIGGFGPLFGGSVLLSLSLLASALLADQKKTLAYTGLALLILTSVIVNPEAWWARYAPQLWLLPVITVMAGLEIKQKIPRFLCLLNILVLSLNLILVSVFFFEGYYMGNIALKNQLEEMHNAKLILVRYDNMYSNRLRLADFHIKYRVVKKLEGSQIKLMPFSDTAYVENQR